MGLIKKLSWLSGDRFILLAWEQGLARLISMATENLQSVPIALSSLQTWQDVRVGGTEIIHGRFRPHIGCGTHYTTHLINAAVATVSVASCKLCTSCECVCVKFCCSFIARTVCVASSVCAAVSARLLLWLL